MARQKEEKVKVVLDTNIILASVSRHSAYKIIFDNLEKGTYDLCVSTEILLEYEEKLAAVFSKTLASVITGALLLKSNVLKTEVYFRWNLVATDPDDNKFVDCALAANADYLVTNDKDYSTLKKIDFPSIRVINIEEFASMLNRK